MHINPLRLMRGYANATAAGATTGVVALTNPSTGAYLLKVLAVIGDPNINALGAVYSFKGRLTNENQGVITRILTDEPPLAGQLDTDQLAAPPTIDLALAQFTAVFAIGAATYPIAVLKPGWSLGAVANGFVNSFAASFIWEAVFPEDFYNESAGDSEDLP